MKCENFISFFGVIHEFILYIHKGKHLILCKHLWWACLLKSVRSDVILISLSVINYGVVLLNNPWKEWLFLHYWQHTVICGINELMTRRKCQAHPSDFWGLSSSYVYFYEILTLDRNFKPCYNPIHEEIIQYAD